MRTVIGTRLLERSLAVCTKSITHFSYLLLFLQVKEITYKNSQNVEQRFIQKDIYLSVLLFYIQRG